ncbi:MAG: XrtA system polysaccharide deacetylase [Myxococcota bacterium]
MRHALTIDVEDYFQVSAFEGVIDREHWPDRESRVVRNTRALLDLFDWYNRRGTFFILGWVAERFPELVREIAGRGHEVASHGWSHKLVYNQSPDEFRDETLRSKHLLEDITGERVLGYRAASYSITEKSRWALDVLVDAGFDYDSSIFPIRHDRYGIPGSEVAPHRLQTPNGATLTEFPISVAEVLGRRLPVAGGGYFRIFPLAMTLAGLRQVQASGRPFVFYLHPWEIDPGQPRVPDASVLSQFRHYTNLSRCEARLRVVLDSFELTTMRSVLDDLALLPGAHEAELLAVGRPAKPTIAQRPEPSKRTR